MAKIIEISFVDEDGNVTVYHPITTADAVNGLKEAVEEFATDIFIRGEW